MSRRHRVPPNVFLLQTIRIVRSEKYVSGHLLPYFLKLWDLAWTEEEVEAHHETAVPANEPPRFSCSDHVRPTLDNVAWKITVGIHTLQGQTTFFLHNIGTLSLLTNSLSINTSKNIFCRRTRRMVVVCSLL